MSIRRFLRIILIASALAWPPASAWAVTLTLNISAGSIGNPITDSLGTALEPGDRIFLYRSSVALNESDLFSEVFEVLPGGGVSLINPDSVLLSTSIGSGISPPINLAGRMRGQLDLGNLQSPTAPIGTNLFLLAVNSPELALATEAGVSREAFPIASLPDVNDPPPLPVDYDVAGFSTVAVPQPSTIVLLLSGLCALALYRRGSP